MGQRHLALTSPIGSPSWRHSYGAARLEFVGTAAREAPQLHLDGLALPRIGAGLDGFHWTDVRQVLEEELAALPYAEVWSL